MGADTVEGVILNVLGLPDVIADAVAVKWMPHDAYIEIIKDTGIIHDNLAGHDLFCRTTIHNDRSLCAGSSHVFLEGTGCCADRSSKQIMSAGMTNLRQCIVFCQKSKHRFAGTPDSGKCSIDASCFPGYLKPLFFQKVRQPFG